MFRVDFVSSNPMPKYSEAVLRRLQEHLDVRRIIVRWRGSTQIRATYQLMEHIFATALRRRNGAVLHIDTQMLSYILALPAKRPTVVTCHDIVQFLPEFDDPSYVTRNRIVDKMTFAMLAQGLRHAGRIIAVSHHTRDALVRLGYDANKIDVVYMGVDQSVYRPRERGVAEGVLRKYRIPRDRPIVLFVGSEHPRKNIPGLLRAFAQIRRETGAVLVKVGEPRQPQRQSLIDLAQSLGIADSVVFLDLEAEEDMPLLYSIAKVVVLASFYEGFGLPPLEAMACGTPVVVSKTTSLREVVGDAGLMVDPNQPREISAAVFRVLTNPTVHEDLRTRGLERSSRFGWSQTVAGIVRSYEEALSSSS